VKEWALMGREVRLQRNEELRKTVKGMIKNRQQLLTIRD
jgi:hypothetical protein